MKVFHQSGEDGAISTLRAATDPSLTGQGFKYFGPWYKGPLIIHTGNDSTPSSSSLFCPHTAVSHCLFLMSHLFLLHLLQLNRIASFILLLSPSLSYCSLCH